MKKRVQMLLKASRLEIAAVIGLVFAGGLLLFRLGSVPHDLSAGELRAYHHNLQSHQIANNPLSAPYKIADFVVLHLHQYSVAAARLTSVGFALLAIALFFSIIRRWHGKRSAWLATGLFATSGWILHVGRLGTADILWVVVPLALILLSSWLNATERHGLALLATVLVFGLTLFVPAGIWFVTALIFLLSKALAGHVREAKDWQPASAALIFLLFLGALAFSLFRSPELVRPWLGLPQTLPSVTEGLRQWADSLLYLFVRGPGKPEVWLAHTPILDVFTTVMCLLGAYFYAKHFRNFRARTLATFALLGSVFTALNGAAGMSFVVPLTYLVAATGVTYLLHEWLAVFPRNPVARYAGIALIGLVIAGAAAYHIAAYFVAWHNSPATSTTFQQKL
jgi:hypothetical protein